jgi:hypothetical protein
MRMRLRSSFSLLVAFGIVTFFVAASGGTALADADTLGPNLQVVSQSGPTGSGGGSGSGCGAGGSTTTYDTSATDPGVTVTENNPCIGAGIGTFTETITSSVAGLNGYEIGDLSASVTCGVTSGASMSLALSGSLGSLVLDCPVISSDSSPVPTVAGEVDFPPVSSGTLSIVLAVTGTSADSAFVFDGFTTNLSLTPEPNSFLLMCTGFVGIVGMARRRVRRS